jgi:hypothetical protein
MSQNYVTQKTAEALQACAGNTADAALLLQAWCESDDRLRATLTAPVLKNLCLLAVQRVAAKHQESATPESVTGASENDLLQAIGNKNALTMSSNRRSASPPPRGSARHQQAVSTLAMAFKSRRRHGV